jgi:hypothetical protein
MKRVLTILAAATILAACALMLERTSPTITPARAATTTDITLTEAVCGDPSAHCKNVTVRDRPFSFGNRILFSLPLSSAGRVVGRDQGECFYMNPASEQVFCTFNLRLSGGVVSVQGTLPSVFGKTGAIPVTGGTGVFEGAYGHLTQLASHGSAGQLQYQLHVITP